MDDWHSLLKRQLKRCFGDAGRHPKEWAEFLQAVSDAYRQCDADRLMIERSLALASRELIERNEELQRELQERHAAEEDLTHKMADMDRLNHIMMGREERIIELKDQVKQLQERVQQLQGVSR